MLLRGYVMAWDLGPGWGGMTITFMRLAYIRGATLWLRHGMGFGRMDRGTNIHVTCVHIVTIEIMRRLAQCHKTMCKCFAIPSKWLAGEKCGKVDKDARCQKRTQPLAKFFLPFVSPREHGLPPLRWKFGNTMESSCAGFVAEKERIKIEHVWLIFKEISCCRS